MTCYFNNSNDEYSYLLADETRIPTGNNSLNVSDSSGAYPWDMIAIYDQTGLLTTPGDEFTGIDNWFQDGASYNITVDDKPGYISLNFTPAGGGNTVSYSWTKTALITKDKENDAKSDKAKKKKESEDDSKK